MVLGSSPVAVTKMLHFELLAQIGKIFNFSFELLTRWLNFYFFALELKKNSLRVTNSMGALSFSHFQVTNVKLINKKNPYILQFQNDMDCIILLRFFVCSLLCCKYIYDIYLSNLDFNGFFFSNIFIYKITEVSQRCEPKEVWPHAGLYKYNGRQIELFHMKWFSGG